MGIIQRWLTFFLACLLLLTASVAADTPTKVQLTTVFEIFVHQQSAAYVDAFAELMPVEALSLWKDGKPTDMCQIVPANMSRSIKGAMPFYEENTAMGRMDPIYSFEDLQHLKNAIDLINFRERYYVLFEDGAVNVYSVSNISAFRIELERRLELKGNQTFDEGYLTASDKLLLYVTSRKLWSISDSGIQEVFGYIPNENFENARLYDDRLFVAMGVNGFAIYSNVTTERVEVPDVYATANFFSSPTDVSDIDYCGLTQTLFILDRLNGVKEYSLGKSGKVSSDGSAHYVKRGGCDIMIHHDNFLLLSCPNLVIYNIFTKQILERPQSDILPEDILAFGEGNNIQVVLVGDSHLAYYANFSKNPIYTATLNPTRMLLEANNTYVVINDFELVRMTLSPRSEVVKCGMPKELPPGLHHLEIHALGDCNSTFLKQRGLTMSLPDNSTCEYVAPLSLYVWTERSVKWKVFAIVGGLLGVCVTIFLGWCCFKNCRLERRYMHLTEEIGAIDSERLGSNAQAAPPSDPKEAL